MSWYRRAKIKGGTLFFTVALADRSSDLLIKRIDLLRRSHANVQRHHPFETIAICILPDHLHAIWSLPADDADFASRWNRIKGGFSRRLPNAPQQTASKIAKREKGIWQRRYWEHSIRDDEDLTRHVDYIHFNRSNIGSSVTWSTGLTATFISTLRAARCQRIGAVTFAMG